MPYTLTDVMLTALEAYLRQPLPAELAGGSDQVAALAKVVVGWRSQAEDAVLPIVGLDAPIKGERVGRAPVAISHTQPADPADPSITSVIVTGAVTVPIVVNVWATSQEERSIILQALDVALQGDVGDGSSLIQVSPAAYFGLPITYWRDGTPQFSDSIQSAGGEEWRATFDLMAEAHEVVLYAGNRIINLSTYLEMAFGRGPVTFQETFSVFAP